MKKGEFRDSEDGCAVAAFSGFLVVLGVLAGLAGVAAYGVSEFLARV